VLGVGVGVGVGEDEGVTEEVGAGEGDAFAGGCADKSITALKPSKANPNSETRRGISCP
jgi:hypothetical protein